MTPSPHGQKVSAQKTSQFVPCSLEGKKKTLTHLPALIGWLTKEHRPKDWRERLGCRNGGLGLIVLMSLFPRYDGNIFFQLDLVSTWFYKDSNDKETKSSSCEWLSQLANIKLYVKYVLTEELTLSFHSSSMSLHNFFNNFFQQCLSSTKR